MLRVAYVLLTSTVLILAPLSGVDAQGTSEDITIVAILRMAAQEAEKGPDEKSRIISRDRVALTMVKTGQAASFGSYVDDARKARQRMETVLAQRDEVDAFNLELEARARQAFLAGDVERAKDILGQCRTKTPVTPSRCAPIEWDYTDGQFKATFVMWEVEEGRFGAALQRLKTIVWYPPARAIGLILLGSYVVGGDSEKIKELRQLAEEAGGVFESCILMVPSSPNTVEDAAVIRMLACDGQAQSALGLALSRPYQDWRLGALLVIAEGLAGIPGLSSLGLQYY
jgi:hypothetical protein